jgi:hypothetical protein
MQKVWAWEMDRDTDLSMRAAWGQLRFAQRRFEEVLPLLKGTPEITLAENAGETSGLRAQLLARPYRALGQHYEFKSCCEWLRTNALETLVISQPLTLLKSFWLAARKHDGSLMVADQIDGR